MLHYRKFGRGKPIILIHGFTNNSTRFIHAKKYLKGYKVILPDLPGHGKSLNYHRVSWSSISSNLTEIIKKEGIDEYVIGGHSLGGMATLNHYIRRKKGIKGLMVLASTAHYSPNMARNELMQYLVHLSNDFKGNKKKGLMSSTIRRYKFIKNINPNLLKNYLDMILHLDIRENLKQSAVPAMVLQAKKDLLITKENTIETARVLNAELYQVKGVHDIFLENSQSQIYSIIRRFLKCINY